GDIDAEKLLAEIFEAVAVGEGADEPGGDLGAGNGRAGDTQIMLDHRDIKAAEMEYFETVRIGELAAEIRRIIAFAVEFHEMRIAISGGQLDQAKPVAVGDKTHRFAVDSNLGSEVNVIGQVAQMRINRHYDPPVRLAQSEG